MKSNAKNAFPYVTAGSVEVARRLPLGAGATAQRDASAIRFDVTRRVFEVGTLELRLKKTSFHLLTYLVQRSGSWISACELRDNVLKAHFRVGASNVRWHVLQTRRALGTLAWCLHGCRRGYMFELSACDTRHCKRALRGS